MEDMRFQCGMVRLAARAGSHSTARQRRGNSRGCTRDRHGGSLVGEPSMTPMAKTISSDEKGKPARRVRGRSWLRAQGMLPPRTLPDLVDARPNWNTRKDDGYGAGLQIGRRGTPGGSPGTGGWLLPRVGAGELACSSRFSRSRSCSTACLWSYIVFADAWVWRPGAFLLRDRPWNFSSSPSGRLPSGTCSRRSTSACRTGSTSTCRRNSSRGVLTFFAYATVVPASSRPMISCVRTAWPTGCGCGLAHSLVRSRLSVLVGLVMLISPLLWPRYAFPWVWGFAVFLGDPSATRRAGAGRSLCSPVRARRSTPFIRLLLAGLICGACGNSGTSGHTRSGCTPSRSSRTSSGSRCLPGFLGFPPSPRVLRPRQSPQPVRGAGVGGTGRPAGCSEKVGDRRGGPRVCVQRACVCRNRTAHDSEYVPIWRNGWGAGQSRRSAGRGGIVRAGSAQRHSTPERLAGLSMESGVARMRFARFARRPGSST